MTRSALIVIAKAPVPGRSKTRLCPPCTPAQAAGIAEAALADTLAAAVAVAGASPEAVRTILALDGAPGAWLPAGVDVIPQRGAGLAARLAAAFADVGGPALLIGMDTPQAGPGRLVAALRTLGAPDVDAVLGGAPDGGYWAIGLRRPDPRVFRGVPMSSATTGAAQRARLAELGLRWGELAPLRDVDRFEDARAAAAAMPPAARFPQAVAAVDAALCAAA